MPELKDPAIKLFGKTIQLSHDVVLKKTTVNEHVDDTTSDQSAYLRINDDPKTPTKKENPMGNSNPEEKPQKPDKILSCPRCNSMDTKFCYYNNYNVNQPRHFCRNCQRYWTAGGTLRNTPVGSGRRKNKSLSSASYYRHLIVNFGETMNQALNFSDKSQKSEDDRSNSASNLVENGGNNGVRILPKCPVQIPCFPSSQLCHPWSSAQYRPPTNLYDSGFPVNLYPTPRYWGWSMPMPMEMTLMNPNLPLGKHSRDGNLPPKDKDSETSRINYPNKAAKSSLWSSLGISKDENGSDPINGAIFSKAFQSKIDEGDDVGGSSFASLQANPAALSRSFNFRET